MVDGWWEVDVPKKANSFCARCAGGIGTAELRFQWCPSAGGDKPYLHVLCAVKAGAKQYARVSKASLRKSTGLTGAQRETLASLLAAPGEAAAAALLRAAGGSQAAGQKAPPAPTAKRAGSATAGEPPAKRARTSSGPVAAKVVARVAAKAKAKARGTAAARGEATPKAKAKARAQAKSGISAAAPALGTASPKGKAAISAKDLAKFEALKQTFSSWSGEKLKALLKANDQSRSGNKAVLVAKCADGAAFGKLPRCPKCFGGKIKFRLPGADGSLLSLFRLMGGAYGQDKEDDQGEEKLKERKRFYCTGFFDDDEKQECNWQADSVKREAWVST